MLYDSTKKWSKIRRDFEAIEDGIMVDLAGSTILYHHGHLRTFIDIINDITH